MLTDHDRTTKIEHPAVLRAWRVLDFFAQIALGKYDTAETWARVPAADSVVLLKPEVRKGRGVFVRLDNQGRTLTPDGSLLMLQQNQAAIKANRDPHKDYKRVWLPRYWRTRVHAVVYTALALSGTVVATALFAPLIVGRLILDRAFGHPVHDGYNWVCPSLLSRRPEADIISWSEYICSGQFCISVKPSGNTSYFRSWPADYADPSRQHGPNDSYSARWRGHTCSRRSTLSCLPWSVLGGNSILLCL